MKKVDVIKYFGSASKLASALGIKPAAISQWKEYIPPLRAYQLEHLTNGKLKANKPLQALPHKPKQPRKEAHHDPSIFKTSTETAG
ncbi:Cro/CI family transcriptional regulator [Zooshikella ganghwensis]|uniref:Cro/CI family transcriptional regulator n=1 Tax=Zooshikella ganghwensis TaxID=202772 RepID=UPI000428BF82|nr:Cro/CI family transcriptional regulator [Zooshikella ganghwensis]